MRQQQSLVLTPQLQQAIRLLQMSNLELASAIDHEVAENPFLQRRDGEPPPTKGPVDTASPRANGNANRINAARGNTGAALPPRRLCAGDPIAGRKDL